MTYREAALQLLKERGPMHYQDLADAITAAGLVQTSIWSRRPLEPEQIRYAALDAEVLVQPYGRFVPVRSWTPVPMPANGGRDA